MKFSFSSCTLVLLLFAIFTVAFLVFMDPSVSLATRIGALIVIALDAFILNGYPTAEEDKKDDEKDENNHTDSEYGSY